MREQGHGRGLIRSTLPDMSQASLLNLLSRMEKYKASDLFISEDKIPALRIDGSVRRLKMEPTTTEEIGRAHV